jgi:hypothetical protein
MEELGMLDCPLHQFLHNPHADLNSNLESYYIRLELSHSPVMKEMRILQARFCKQANEGMFGELINLDVNEILPDNMYKVREEFLQICSKTDETFQESIKKTKYFQDYSKRKNEKRAIKACDRYRTLLSSIKQNHRTDRQSAPVLMNREGGTRLDGTHRVSILRYLGKGKIPCIMVEESEYYSFMEKNLSRGIVKDYMNSLGKWYHAIELLPGLWTRNLIDERKSARKLRKEDVMIAAISEHVKGRSVLDIGSNNGLLSLQSAYYGAISVRGLERSTDNIVQAEFARMIWNVTKPRICKVQFEVIDLEDDSEFMKDSNLLIAGCVIYHLEEGLHPFMKQLQNSNVTSVLIQGNLSRLKNIPVINSVNSDTEAKFFVDLDRIKTLFGWYGFSDILYEEEGAYPVIILERNLNQQKSEGPLVITGGTTNYAGHLNVLLSSLTYTNPDARIIVGCFGWGEELIREFEDLHAVEFVKVEGSQAMNDDVSNNVRSGEALKMKIEFIKNMYIDNMHNGILWIDADSVVTDSLNPLFSELKSGDFDVMCTHRSHRKKEHTIFATGVLGFAATDLGNNFIEEFHKGMLLTKGLDEWFHDQIQFCRLFNRLNPRLYALSKTEHTIKGDENALIYSRREAIDNSPADVARKHGIPIQKTMNLPASIYPI